MSEQDDARKEFIAQLEASGIAPTWEKIYELNATIAGLRGQLIEAQASMSFLQRQTAAAQADERARRDAALGKLNDLRWLLDKEDDAPEDAELRQVREAAMRLAVEAIHALTGQDEEEREEAAGK
jgi:hypothetical protein